MVQQLLPYFPKYSSIAHCRKRYWVEDESLLGLNTITRRLITLEGISPVGLGQWLREYDDDDLYGIAEPRTGASFFWEFSHLDSLGFGKLLKLFFSAVFRKP
ncbi:MAG: hypothetical protein BRC43_02400 [Cyanobacteria bacterium QS_3_48_167]|nr:MAG: hypothetical protein BRC43_02400 [Cyanobacteria bacterium QS_3_48_167]